MKIILSLSLILFLSACMSIPKNLIEPKVDLQNVDVSDANFSEATLIFQFLVQNPNEIPLAVDSVDYDLALNGKPLTKGTLEEGLKVGSKSSAVIPLPIRVKYSDLASSLSSLLSQGSTPYQVKGAVKVGLFSIPFDKQGEVKLQQ